MGILNVTPDSFSDGGQHNQIEDAVAFGLRLVNDGADILDVGGESTRPGSEFVSADEELNRTIPVIERLVSETDVPVSIDTTKAIVAEEAIRAGATIVNDISGLTFDAEMIEVCSHSDVGICLMHIRGTPKTMQENPEYEDVCREVVEFLCDGMRRCEAAGIDRERLCLDPGIGFGKTADHNMTLMRAIPRLRTELERPLLIGHSRKRFLSKVLGRDVEERTAGTIGVSIALAQLGADLLRVHDVRAVRDALVAWQSLSE
ncbi:MAG: dihydropteroate synthase [Planctomycetaceae bacterium]|nr:dihydropteroate synthase [Planctomycetaceae bacterium]